MDVLTDLEGRYSPNLRSYLPIFDQSSRREEVGELGRGLFCREVEAEEERSVLPESVFGDLISRGISQDGQCLHEEKEEERQRRTNGLEETTDSKEVPDVVVSIYDSSFKDEIQEFSREGTEEVALYVAQEKKQ